MRIRALLPLLILPVVVGTAMFAERFASKLHTPTPLPQVPEFKFAIAREDLVQKKSEDEENVESIDYRVLTPAAFVFTEDSNTGFASIDRRPINERFRLVSILLGAQGSSALVDKRVVKVGDWLGGYRVVSITREGLNLRGPRGRERLNFMTTEELALREMPFVNDAQRSAAVRERSTAAAASQKNDAKTADVAISPDIKAQMERDYQRLLKDLKP